MTEHKMRFRFSIKWILVLMFLGAGLSAYYWYSTRPMLLQNEALTSLRKLVKKKKPTYYPLKEQPPITTRWEYYPWFGKEKRAEVLTKVDFHAKVDNGQDWDVYQIVLKDEDMPMIGQFSELKYLELNGSMVTDDGLRYLSKLQKLEHLDLSNTKVTGEGFRFISVLPNLKTLILQEQTITGTGLRWLSKCKRLEQLIGCSVVSINDQQWAGFAANSSLRKLQFGVLGVDDLRLENLPRLAEFKVANGSFKKVTIRKCDALELIEIGEGSFSQTMQFYAENLRLLRSLKNENATTDVRVHGCPELKEIHLERLDNEVDAFRGLPKLEQLFVRNGALSPRVGSEIFQATTLQKLSINVGGDDSVLAGLSRLTELDELWIAETKLTEPAIRELGELPKLQSLGISHSDCPELDFGTVVKECDSLSRIWLNNCRFKNVQIRSHRRLGYISTGELITNALEFSDLPSLTSSGNNFLNAKSIAVAKLPKASRLRLGLAPGAEVDRIEIDSLPFVRYLDIFAEGASSRRKPPGPAPKVPAKVFVDGASFARMRLLSNAPSNKAYGTAGVRGGIRLPGCDVVNDE